MVKYREMTRPDVLAFLDLTDELGIVAWLNGGWGVDALLGEQTRRHEDLDLFLPATDSATLVQHLELRGFAPVPREDTTPWNFVYGDAYGREIDLHLFERAADTITYAVHEIYPAAILEGYGTVGGRTVRCIAPEWEVRFHTGYPVDEQDWQDVSALCAKYSIPVPEEYARFGNG
jgi:lincosamide nucleotidyltransferase A/C/D/E